LIPPKSVDEYFERFKEYLKTKEAREFEARHERKSHFQSVFSKENIRRISEEHVGEIIASLWANAGWTNKDYVVHRVLSNNDIETLRHEFNKLLWGEQPLAERYDSFRSLVRGMGPAQITEIMSFVHPDKYGLWNERSRAGLETLGLLPTKKYQVTGAEYEKCVEAFRKVKALLEERGMKNIDLLDVDLFLYFLSTHAVPEEAVAEEYVFEHPEIAEKLEKLGVGLGFDVEREKKIAKGAKIGNLGTVSYAFEVQGKGGSIDSLLLNLQKARNDPTVQKVIAVSDAKTLEKIRDEASGIKELKDSLGYMDVKDVEKGSQLIQELGQILTKLELVRPAFAS